MLQNRDGSQPTSPGMILALHTLSKSSLNLTPTSQRKRRSLLAGRFLALIHSFCLRKL